MDKKNILLVEDEILIAMAKQQELEKYGYTVQHVNTGEKAVARINANNDIDLILMDIDLGKGIDGTEAAELILKDNDIPIVFMSSHTESDVVEKTERITSYGYVVKSSSITVLDVSIKMAFKLFESSAALKLSEEKFRIAFTTSPDAININDIDGCYININEGFTRLTGYTEEDVIGVRSSDIEIWAIPSDREILVKGLKESGRVENLESVFRCKDGSLKTALMSAHLIFLNKKPHILSITRDITELKKADKEINQYEHIVSSSSDMMAFLDKDLNFIIVNSAYSKSFGLTPIDFIGKRTIDIFGEEYFNKIIKPNADRCLSGEEISFQNWYDFPGIGRCFIELNYYPYYNAVKKIEGYVVNVRDITERKQAEDEIKKQLLEKEIILKETHHRIKNNFTSVGSLLSLQAQSNDNPEVQSALNVAIGRVKGFSVLYEKLLLSDNYQTTSVKEYLNNLVDDISNLFSNQQNLTIEKQFDDLQLDSERLFPIGLIVNELLTNTMKYAFTNRDSGLINIQLKKIDKEITLTISDNGNGLSDDFDINTTNGFGFKLIRMLSEQLGGNFIIDNHNGTRSAVKFYV